MPLFYFSEEFKARMREAVKPLSVRVLREVAESPPIRVIEMRCLSCGYMPRLGQSHITPATAVHDCEWTHEYSWDTGARCGGQIAFVTEPA